MEDYLISEENFLFLLNTYSIRNHSPAPLCKRFHYKIPISTFYCYSVGIINGIKRIQIFKIINQLVTGIKTYKIQWWNTAFTEYSYINLNESEAVCFWVHSGGSLKKNFFLFEDKLNIFKSTYIFDRENSQFFRLMSLQNYFYFEEKIEKINEYIYTSPHKVHKQKKITEKRLKNNKNKEIHQIKKISSKLLNDYNMRNCLINQFPVLFKELDRIYNCNQINVRIST